MAVKLEIKEWPAGHTAEDFKCFGPAAVKDGEFVGTMMSNMGCFDQSGKDTNKEYHSAVVQSTKTQEYSVFNKWGRVGDPNQAFQFIVCTSKEEAIEEYIKVVRSKNDKRGVWVQHSTLGRILQAKPNKDCYLVRAQATCSNGLPDAKTIKFHEGKASVAASAVPAAIKPIVKKIIVEVDQPTQELLKDLNVATVSYTRGAMTDDSLPTLSAINEARDVLMAALNRLKIIGHNVQDQVADSEMQIMTRHLYSRIPKKKARNAPVEKWALSEDNILLWQQDLDAFESALSAVDAENEHDSFGGLPLKMRWLDPRTKKGEFIRYWFPLASQHVHENFRHKLTILNVWEVERDGEDARINNGLKRIGKVSPEYRPFHQPDSRPDLDPDTAKKYYDANAGMMFHGSKSVNIRGILEKGLVLPSQLVGMSFSAQMFGLLKYYADDWKKSAQYTSHRNSVYTKGSGCVGDRGAFMFVADVIVGKPYLANGPFGYTDAPDGTHSIYGKAGYTKTKGSGKLLSNEWIVPKDDQDRLRYLIEFKTAA